MLKTSRGLIKTILFTFITFGIYPFYLIHAFAKETNIACNGDGHHTSGLLLFLIFNSITGGLYGIIWRCMWISRCNGMLARYSWPQGLQISTYLLTLFLLGPLTLGIMYLIVLKKELSLQNDVNDLYNQLNFNNMCLA